MAIKSVHLLNESIKLIQRYTHQCYTQTAKQKKSTTKHEAKNTELQSSVVINIYVKITFAILPTHNYNNNSKEKPTQKQGTFTLKETW